MPLANQIPFRFLRHIFLCTFLNQKHEHLLYLQMNKFAPNKNCTLPCHYNLLFEFFYNHHVQLRLWLGMPLANQIPFRFLRHIFLCTFLNQKHEHLLYLQMNKFAPNKNCTLPCHYNLLFEFFYNRHVQLRLWLGMPLANPHLLCHHHTLLNATYHYLTQHL